MTKASGTDLSQRNGCENDGNKEEGGLPNGLIVFGSLRPIFKEAVLTYFDTSRRLCNSKHRESHLWAVEIYES